MICPNCGEEMSEGHVFCDQCGAPLRKKKSVLPVMLIFILAVVIAGGTAVWVLTDDYHTLTEAKEQYREARDEFEQEEEIDETDADGSSADDSNDELEDSQNQADGKPDDSEQKTDSEAGAEDTDEKEADSYILPQSNKKYLTDQDVEGLSLQEINYAKNEIYARHGRKFDSTELQEYFNSKSWYTGKYEPADFDQNYSAKMLNDYEKKNAEFLRNIEFSRSPNGYQLDAG